MHSFGKFAFSAFVYVFVCFSSIKINFCEDFKFPFLVIDYFKSPQKIKKKNGIVFKFKDEKKIGCVCVVTLFANLFCSLSIQTIRLHFNIK